jgi:hypothetical protein
MRMIENKIIWKYEATVQDVIEINMPKGAEILTIDNQYSKRPTLCIWALVDPKNEIEKRSFRVYGTGHPITIESNFPQKYINSFFLKEGALVFMFLNGLVYNAITTDKRSSTE